MSWRDLLAVLCRLAIGLALLTPLAAYADCALMPFRSVTGGPPWCVVHDVFGAGVAQEPLAMRILPEWPLLPIYGMLRAITLDIGPLDAKTLGVIVAGAAYAAPLVLALFNWSKTPPLAFLSLLAIPPILFALGWIGAQAPTEQLALFGFVLTVAYFAIFLLVFPMVARRRAR